MDTPNTDDMKSRIEEAEAAEADRTVAPEQQVVAAVPGGEEVVNFSDDTPTEKTFADQASEAGEKAVAFIKEHPLATVAGGVALGILVAGMFKGPRRAAAAGGAKAAGLAALGSEIALAFASQMADAASDAGRAGARRLDDFGDTVGDVARKARRDASYRAAGATDAARIAQRDTVKKLARALKR